MGGHDDNQLHQEQMDKSSSVGFLGLPEAPVYYPTEEEFKDPLAYIEKIREEAEAYGICKIIPPKSWDPPFAIDKNSFSFPTKLQAIHHLQMRPAARDADTFKLEYNSFLEKVGQKVEDWPQFLGKQLDLCQLFSAVKRHGGCHKVTKENKWGEVLQILDPSCGASSQSESLRSTLQKLYETYLYEFEVSNSKLKLGKRNRASDDNELRPKKKRTARQHKVEADATKELHQDNTHIQTDQICERCQSGVHEQSILLCDRCNRGWHLYCLTPPLSSVPAGNWYCFDCLTSEKESFGFTAGQVHTFDSFRRAAERFKKKWFNGKEASFSELEEEFWNVVERRKGPVEVLYGSDLASEVYGSGFPRASDPIPEWADKAKWEKYASSPWNLNNITKLDDSVLKHVEENIPGVTVPWVYMGMLFSSFCWHYEDQCFYSINYLHWGEPKCWYGVPGSAIGPFEQVMHKMFPDLFEAHPDLLFQLVTMLNPKVLQENNVPVCTTIQECGNFVITFPRSYHGGFNHGLNCAEAVNFATLDWLPFGRFGVERTRLYHKAAVLSQEEILCVVAKNAQSYAIQSPFLKQELRQMISLERTQRIQLWKNGIVRSCRMSPRQFPEAIGMEEDPECVICQYYLFISAITCSCCPGRVVCLQHSEQLCECSKDQQKLLYRYSLAELDDLQLQLQSLYNGNNIATGQKKRGRPPNVLVVTKKVNGTMVSHKDMADIWCAKAESILKATPKVLDIQELLQDAEQFLWAGHEMDPVRILEDRLRSVQSWAQSVVSCIASSGLKLEYKKAEKVTLATAQNLLSVNPAPCDMEMCILKLKALAQITAGLQERVQSFFLTSPPWEMSQVEFLWREIEDSPLNFPEAKELEKLVITTQIWRDEVRNLLLEPRRGWCSGHQNDTDMDKLHRLQEEADKLCILLPEMEILDAYISKLEKWQERANTLLREIVPLQTIEELISEIEDVPVYFHEADVLEQRIHEARIWIQSACKILADVKQQGYYKASIDLLSAVVTSGEVLKVEVKEIENVKLELTRVRWLERATMGLKSQLTTSELMDILEEGSCLGLQQEQTYVELSKVVEVAREWEFKALLFLQDGASLEDYRILRWDSLNIYVSLAGWADVNKVIMQAESFLHHAEPYIHQPGMNEKSNLKFEELQELIEQSKGLKIDFPERALLTAVSENVLSWKKRASDLISHAKQDLNASKYLEQLFETTKEEAQSKIMLANDNLLTDLRRMVKEGKSLRFKFSEMQTLKTLVTATNWNHKLLKLLISRPNVEEIELLIQEAKDFSDYIIELSQLECHVNKAKEWGGKLSSTLNRSDMKCTLHELEELFEEAKALQITMCSDFAKLEQMLNAHKSRQNQILKCLYSTSEPISWEELYELHEMVRDSQIKFDEDEVLITGIDRVEKWLQKCQMKLLRNSDMLDTPLRDVLSKIQNSVENALLQLKKKTYIEGHNSYAEEEVCHLCRKDLDCPNNSTLTCDNCRDRYHKSCLGMELYQEWSQNPFVCSFCNAYTAGILWFDEEVLSKICITKRPTVKVLHELQEAAEEIPFRTKEIKQLEAILKTVRDWDNCLQNILEPILRSHTSHTYSSSLLAAMKIAGTMEVQLDGECQLALALSVNAWRMQAKSILESSSKPSYRTVCRVLKEGLSIPFLSHDCVLKDLKTWETMASVWLSQAKMAMEDDGDTPLEEVNKLIVEGERLPIAVNKEIEDLKSRTVLYCICRKPYDKERAMIACDSCSEWYHFDCMNLPEPDSSDDECGNNMLQRYGSTGDFLCPSCKVTETVQSPKRRTDNSGHESYQRESFSTPPLWHARGKRSTRVSVRVRADLQQRWQNQSDRFYSRDLSKVATNNNNEGTANSNGRPCRRTAGQNSRFESFVLLMHPGS